MTFLNSVVSGAPKVGQRIVIAGVEGVGKTTLACDTPNSLLIPLEQGFNAIKSARLPAQLQTWAEIENLCNELREASQKGRLQKGSSIVWDSATALERIIHKETLNRDTQANKLALGKTHSMETAHGGYGKAYPIANQLFEVWVDRMDELAFYGGINVIVTCHVFVVRIADPSAGEYDTFELLMHSPKNAKTYGKREHLTQWADGIFFLHEPVFIRKEEGAKVSLGISRSEGRVLETDRSPAWTAKNRYGLSGPIRIPVINGWNAVAGAIYQASGNNIDLYNRAVPTK